MKAVFEGLLRRGAELTCFGLRNLLHALILNLLHRWEFQIGSQQEKGEVINPSRCTKKGSNMDGDTHVPEGAAPGRGTTSGQVLGEESLVCLVCG